MKVDVLTTQEIFRTKHYAVNIQVDEAGNTYKLEVIIVEDYDIRHDKYHYEIEKIEWLTAGREVNRKEIEKKLEGYLLDNIEDIIS